jgi:YesN/AraC family two-component response regulator
VADDEPIERTVVSKKINKFYGNQVEVVLAENGSEVVEKFKEYEFQAVILDISMPGMNGLEAARIIRDRDAYCSIIFLTAFDEFSYAKKAIEVKALDYLLKPADDDELLAALDEAFNIADNNVNKIKNNALVVKDNDTNIKMNVVSKEISRYIEEHYMQDISLQDVAAAMGYSDAYFCKIFKQCFDKSFIAYLNDFRTQKAISLLGDVTISIKDISSKAGYRDANYFTRIFKRSTGITPSEYRENVLRQKA